MDPNELLRKYSLEFY